MPTLGVLHEAVRAQLIDSQETARHLTVVCSAADFDTFLAKLETVAPRVVIVDLMRLGPEPLKALARLRAQEAVEMIIVIYSFARSELIRQLRAPDDVQVMKSPVSPSVLRSIMATMIAEEIGRSRQVETTIDPAPGAIAVDAGLRKAVSALDTLKRQLEHEKVRESVWRPSLDSAQLAVSSALSSLQTTSN